MTTGLIYVIIFGILLVASIILAIILSKILNNDKGIELTGKDWKIPIHRFVTPCLI